MRYGIFSDIHGNLEAFEAVLSGLANEAIDAYLCVGDIVGYGANPGECIGRVLDLRAVSIAGNHEYGVLGKIDLAYFNPHAADAIVWTQNHLDRGRQDFLKTLPLDFKNEDLIMVHGTLQKPGMFIYLITFSEAAETFKLMTRKVCFVGHTHVPVIIQEQDFNIHRAKSFSITMEPQCKYIINVGSVGQPRDRNPKAAYCIYDTDLNTVDIKRVSYPIEEAQAKIRNAGLPESLATRLAEGW